VSPIDAAAIDVLVACLSNQEKAEPASGFPRDPGAVAGPGLYAWWADDEGRSTLGAPFGVTLPSLIYAGQTGATSRRAGVERVATLRSRIGGNHLNGNAGSSTFRKTLSSVLLAPLQLHVSGKDRLDEASNRSVSMWMRGHLSVVTVQVEERSTLAEIEEAVLAKLDPPLNLMGMAPTPIRARLRELRRELNANHP
jgi:hypothetical protein